MISLSSGIELQRALQNAREVDFAAYMLSPAMERALEAAARRGARVRVRLNGCFPDARDLLRANRDAVRRLRALRADARLVHRTEGDGPPLHLKAAICDGVAYLDDCNFRAGTRDTVVRAGRSTRGVELDKKSALDAEAALLRAAHRGTVEVESESLGYSPVYSALKQLAQHGVHCRLLVSEYGARGNYSAAAHHLADAGVDVRIANSDEKFALCGTRGWIGSANATSYYLHPDQLDWGAATSNTTLLRALHVKFAQNWRSSKALPNMPSS